MRPRATFVAVVVVFASSACSGSDSAEPEPVASSSAAPVETQATPTSEIPPTSETAPETADLGSSALDFFRSTESICVDHAQRFGNPGPSPEQFAEAEPVEALDDGTWRIVDGSGNDLIVDVDDQTIHSVDGPDGILPPEYSFGCPPELYLGGLAS